MARANQVEHGKFLGKICRLLIDLPDWKPPFRKGELVKCVMVSRLGDCGITHDLKAQFGYTLRVEPDQLEIVEGAAHDVDRDL